MDDKTLQGLALALVLFTAAVLFAIRLAGPPNLMDNDQERPASYVLDVVKNGHWAVQHSWMGGVASKPPLYTWLAALATLPFERANLFSLYLPAALSVAGMACVILLSGGRRFGGWAGLLGAMGFLVSPMMTRQIALARTDALFGFVVTLGALAAFRAWSDGRGWTLFWLLAALATLAKGPLGVILAAGGLLASLPVWRGEGRAGPLGRPRRSQRERPTIVGILLFLVITVGWFALAYHDSGQPFVDRVLKRELIGHIVASDAGTLPLVNFYKPFPYFLHRFAPWSLLACIGFWRVLARKAASDEERRFERFLFCWFWLGMIIFSISPHQRADILAPIIPPAALLAGRELGRWLAAVRPARLVAGTAAVAVALLGVTANYYWGKANEPAVRQTLGMKALARDIEANVDPARLMHVDTPFTLQFYLNTMITLTPPEEAAQMLAGTNPVFVAVCDMSQVNMHLPKGTRLQEVAQWPATGEPFVRVVANR